LVRPFNQLREIRGWKVRHVDDSDPIEASPIPGGFHSRNVRHLDKAIRCHSQAETPSFGLAGLEVGEFLATDSIDKKIVGVVVESFRGTGKPAAELF